MKNMIGRRVFVWLAAALCPGLVFAQAVFGPKDYTVSKVAAIAFMPAESSQQFFTSGSLGRFGPVNTDQHFYASLDLPAGSTIDYVGINNLNDGTPGVISVTLRDRDGGTVYTIATVASTPHDTWLTDKNATPLDLEYFSREDSVFILDVEIASSPNNQFFGWVGVWWKRRVSQSPLTTFSDVPLDHPFHRYVEALYAAGITGGYPDGRFGVDDPVTRGEMAVFLSVSLGLHWPL